MSREDLRYQVISSPLLIPHKESRQKTAISPNCLSFSHYRIGHWVDFKRKTRFDCRVICAKSTCICFIRNFNDTDSSRAFRIKNKSKDDRNPSVCHAFPVGSVFLHYFSFDFCHILCKGRPWRNKFVQELLLSGVHGSSPSNYRNAP